MVYFAGELPEVDQLPALAFGAQYLSGVPNYYLFYVVILPFVSTGVIYIAFENQHIRFFQPASEELSERLRNKVQFSKKLLFGICVVFSILTIYQDATHKDHTLPPYAFQFTDQQQEHRVARLYACAKQWLTDYCDDETTQPLPPERYLEELRNNGIDLITDKGFSSLSQWWSHASWLYLFESFLSLLGAFIVSVFFPPVLLLIIVKNHTKQATRNLIIWLLVLVSVWFPTKIYSAWNFNLGDFEAPAIVFVGLAILAIAVLLVFFIRTERNDLAKYVSIITAVFSFALGCVAYVQPEFIHQVVEILIRFGLIYAFIGNYEEEIEEDAA